MVIVEDLLSLCSFKSNKCHLSFILSSTELEKHFFSKAVYRLICPGNFGKAQLGFGSLAVGWHEYKEALKNSLLSP